ncbi:glycine receptor subunit alpha-3-like [Mercenaria mercenaria]|uniref:glycine receptor subunit alpha-3-like n=1 Tax=Mercenaria mercenaria TaxID=6596 RepID=UPI00234F67E5|nr:glycine receptor subunit alpha-3-like [Mercenaria mercenaria]
MLPTVASAFVIVVILVSRVEFSRGQNSNETISTILDQIFDGYDKKIPPNQNKDHDDRQVKVVVNMFINSMFSISEVNMDYSMSMFLRERWIDDRLQYTNTLNLSRIVLENALYENIWMPDMYILNEKESDFHEVTVPNKLIHIYPDGTVQYSARVTGVFSCLMHLQTYPFDEQSCYFEVESYGHSTESMTFVWSENPVSLAKDITFPQFSLSKINSYNCEKDYYGIVYPCIGVEFVLDRNYEYYLVQIYVPSILTVLLSWVNFWLDCEATPARISLGLLTVLTMATQSSGVRANLPRVSYIKAIDVYMAACITFVFLGFVEFAYVNVVGRVDSRKKTNDSNINGNRKDSVNSSKDMLAPPEQINSFLTTELVKSAY